MLWIVVAIVAAVVALVLTVLLHRRWIAREKEVSINPDDIYFFIAMLLGMLGREAYNMLLKGSKFNWVSLAMACIVSPLIFGAVHKAVGQVDVTLPSLCLAFQNGFFWNSIFEAISTPGAE
jgi:hypothetical protein